MLNRITMTVVRFSVSLEKDLLDELDLYTKDNSFANRSQALRYLIENNIVERKWHCNNIVAGAVILMYNQNKRDILTKINEIGHTFHDVILASQHFHLSEEVCLEIIAVRGKAKILTVLSDKLITIKGIKHGKLVMSKSE